MVALNLMALVQKALPLVRGRAWRGLKRYLR